MRCFWLLNHECNEVQLRELHDCFGVGEIVYPSAELAAFWCNLPCRKELETDLLEQWMAGIRSGDIAVVQGDSTYTFFVVSELMDKGVHVYASVTERVAHEERTERGECRITRLFSHRLFREYTR